MSVPIKAALTALCIAVLAWPLLFWSMPTLEREADEVEPFGERPIFNIRPYDELF